jgi:chitinase
MKRLLVLGAMLACSDGADELNHAPVAFVGQQRHAPIGTNLLLDGSKSVDIDGDTLRYRWSLISMPAGSSSGLAGDTTSKPTLTIDAIGTFVVGLVVSDGELDSASAELRIEGIDDNERPLANAGQDLAVALGSRVMLDGSGSSDPEGAPLSFGWMLEAPQGSGAVLTAADVPAPEFVADVAGAYTASLIVSDGQTMSNPDTVTIVAGGDNLPPVARIDGPTSALLGTSVSLDGSTSSDPDGDPLEMTWTFTMRPPSSAANLSASGSSATFAPDAAGTYQIRLEVSDGVFSDDAVHTVEVTQTPDLGPVAPLPFRAIDAEYSRVLDRLVLVSAEPSALHVYDPVSNSDVMVNLPTPPLHVSIAPDGLSAAVGHDGWVSIVALDPPTVDRTIPMAANPSDVVMAGNGFVYGFPSDGQWTSIRCIDIAAETDTQHVGIVREGTRAKLHPSGTRVYGADNGLSPSDIERYDVSMGVAQDETDSPYHGDYPMCGELWISDDGARIFTRCGAVFRSVTDAANDMTYNGSLALEPDRQIEHLDHSSNAGAIAVALRAGWQDNTPPAEMFVFDSEFLALQSTIALPRLETPQGSFQWLGRFVHYSADGSRLIVLLQAEEGSGLLDDQAIAIY